MAELSKSLREAAARAHYEHDRIAPHDSLWEDASENVREDYRLATDPILAALLGACEVHEERGFRLARQPDVDGLEYFELESHVAEAWVRHHQKIFPDAKPEPIRRLVITTAAEEITEEVGRG